MLSTDSPRKFTVPFANAATAGTIRVIPAGSQTGGAASLADGFPALNFQPVGSGGIPPFGQDMNGILNQATADNRWHAAGGAVLWDAAFSAAVGGYPLGAVVASPAYFGQYWLSLIEANTSNPDAGGAGWQLTPRGLASAIGGYSGAITLTLNDRGKLMQLAGNSVVTLPASPPIGMPVSFYANATATIQGGTFFGNGLIGATSIAMAGGDTISLVFTNPNWIVLARNSSFISFNGRVGATTLTSPDVTNALGFTPVRQGGYGAMLNNAISLGWDGIGSILASVDTNTTAVGALASHTWVQSLYAPLASPVFSGTPLTPTPAFGSNAQIPNTAYLNGYYAPINSPSFNGVISGNAGLNAGGPITAAGNVTATNGRLRSTYGAYGSGDVNAAAILSDFYRQTTTGYMFERLPDGMIIQSYEGITTTGIDIIPFPIAFPNACMQVLAHEGSPEGWGTGLIAPTIFGTSQITPASFALWCALWHPTTASWLQAGAIHYRFISIGF